MLITRGHYCTGGPECGLLSLRCCDFAKYLLPLTCPSRPTNERLNYSRSVTSSQTSLPRETILAAPCSKAHCHLEVMIWGESHWKSLENSSEMKNAVFIFGSVFIQFIQANICVLIAALTRRNWTHSPENTTFDLCFVWWVAVNCHNDGSFQNMNLTKYQ